MQIIFVRKIITARTFQLCCVYEHKDEVSDIFYLLVHRYFNFNLSSVLKIPVASFYLFIKCFLFVFHFYSKNQNNQQGDRFCQTVSEKN